MTPQKPSARFEIYRHWPRRLLNRLPEDRKHRMLLRRLGAEFPAAKPFRLPVDIAHLNPLLFVWPTDLKRAYAAFPVAMSLRRTWSAARALHVAPPPLEGFLRTAFAQDEVLALDTENLRLDDAQAMILPSTLGSFQPAGIFLLEAHPSPWHLAMMATSSATLRCHLGQGLEYPYCNLRVACRAHEPLFALGQKLEPLLKGCGLMPQGMTWARLQPPPSAVEEGLKALKTARLHPGNLWAYLPGELGAPGLDTQLSSQLRSREGSLEVFTLVFRPDPSPHPEAPEVESHAGGQALIVHSLSQVLGLTAWIKGAFGPPSALLYLLSLTEIETRTWLSAHEGDLDLTAFNSRFRLL